MFKSHAIELSEVFRCIFQDAKDAFPTLGNELSKDFSTLQSLVEQRGIHVYLVDLPAVGKHLDRCLNDGKYQPCGLPLTKRYTRGVAIPKFLRGLYLLVFDETGCLRTSYNIEAIFFLRQILYLAKKAVVNCSRENVEDEVLEFYQTDLSLPEPCRFWGESVVSHVDVWSNFHGYGRNPAYLARMPTDVAINNRSRQGRSLEVLDFVSNLIVATLGPYDPSSWRFRHGPGAISETTSATCKYKTLRESWSPCLESEFPIADYGFHNHSSWGNWLLTDRESVGEAIQGDMQRANNLGRGGNPLPGLAPRAIPGCRPSSRMVAVPKSFTRPRLIAAEPVAHQFCQQNMWHYFRDRTRDSWIADFIAFSDQTLNQKLCVEGSRNNALATVDLSSASDRVTCDTVGNFFRGNPKLVLALRAVRTHVLSQKLTRKVPALIELRKYSTMGSACTFPIETLIFLGIALSAVLTTRNLKLNLKNVKALKGQVAVFGDDIVVPSDSREQFVHLLEALHFKINDAKTYWTGRFRESCGVDSFSGVEVTPAYWRGTYDSQSGSLDMAVQTSNNFYQKFLLRTAEHMSSTLPGRIAQVAMRSGSFGLQTRTYPENSHLSMRINPGLFLVECLCLQSISVTERTKTEDESALLQYFTEAPSPQIKWESGYNQRPKFRKKLRWVPLESILAQGPLLEGEIVRLHLKASERSRLVISKS